MATITITTPVTQNAGTAFAVSGTYTGTAPTSLNIEIDGTGFFPLPGTTISGGTWSGTITIASVGSHTLTVQESPATSVTATTAAFSVGQITINPVATQITGTAITVSGTYSGVTPAGLTYSLDGGLLVAFSSPTIGGGVWSATTTAGVSTAGTHTIAVAESPATYVFTPTANFTAVVGTISVNAPTGTLFTGATAAVSGTYAGTTPTGINYAFDGGSYTAMSSPTIGGGNWSGTITLPPAGLHTLTVQDANATSVTGTSVYFSVLAGTGTVPAPAPVSTIGTKSDFVRRLLAVLPVHWFPDVAPILTAVVTGSAWAWAQVYGLIQYARTQTRIGTATDMWLDIVSRDFFALALPRRQGEADASFRSRIRARLLRQAATRAGVAAGLTALTGRAPTIIEPWNTGDCGAVGGVGQAFGGGFALNTAGAWGSVLLPYQMFIQVHRPNIAGLANVGGIYYGSGWAGGGIGVGAIEIVSTAMVAAQVGDTDIYQTITDLMPEGTVGWTEITN